MIAERRACLSSFSASISTREHTVLTSRAKALIGHVLLPRTRPDPYSTKDTATVSRIQYQSFWRFASFKVSLPSNTKPA